MLEHATCVQPDLDEFDQKLHDYLRGDSPLITSIAQHLLRSKGKRMRPLFLFLTSRAADNYTPFTVDASLAIELIHTATLLHDDVVDESELRRGQETVNAQWTNLISVLMGDYLFAKAFRIMVDSRSMDLMQAIAHATGRVSVGELRQIEETGNYALSEEEYLTIIADKTASLFSLACETGPILAGRGRRDRQRFAHFGEKIGTAFQIVDDLLDFVGDAEITGKEPGNDVLTGKVTLPLIHALKKAGRGGHDEIIAHLRRRDRRPSFERVLAFVREQGGIEHAYGRARALSEEGLAAITPVTPSEYFDCLVSLVQFTISRAS
ncbi:MAG TPA: polyprenyl synthetase family protein [candidate division Zixibacteria bacterium]|nr:polyprenyl synthetase family protein [candidate division Zixibacteria bacterium]MDM7973667.1 polyprenyl synthetase family protein [candidate division Zixibacteria bacterium]HOZ07147.1 polyprenyl synthetase family protein [candidate division Zixibacteria bacterium]HPM37591.1 polyprenyl synthetase family protein [candidate division Zixibacteria bacterium]